MAAERPRPRRRLPRGDQPAVQVPDGRGSCGRGLRARARQPHRLLHRSSLLRLQRVLPRARLPQAPDYARATRRPGEGRRCHGLGLQQENVLLQWHYVLEVCGDQLCAVQSYIFPFLLEGNG